MRIPFLILLSFGICKVSGQDSLFVMLAKKIKSDTNHQIEKTSWLSFKACDSTLIDYVSLKINQKNGNSKANLKYDAVSFYQWKDSILLTFKVPAEYATNKLTYELMYHLTCKEKLRGTESSFYVNNIDTEKKNIVVTFKSEPAGARVYLVPKFYWDRHFASKNIGVSITDILDFIIPTNLTPVSAFVEEYVYYAVYDLNGTIKKIKIAPKMSDPTSSVFIDFNKN